MINILFSSIYPLVWRFLPVLDPTVDIVLSRDLDSTLSEREWNAFDEFLSFNRLGKTPQVCN